MRKSIICYVIIFSSLLSLPLFSCVEEEEEEEEESYSIKDENIIVDQFPLRTNENYNLNSANLLPDLIGYGITIRKTNLNHWMWTHVRYKDGANTYGIDPFDTAGFPPQPYLPTIYTTYPFLFPYKFFNNHLATPFNLSDKIDIAISIVDDGYYEICLGVPQVNQTGVWGEPFISGQPIYLKDFQEGVTVDLQTTCYTFYSQSTPVKRGRFMLSYTLH